MGRVGGAVYVSTTGDEVEVRYLPDVPYRSADGAMLRLQVLMPTTRNGMRRSLPCVVFAKGSAWRAQKLHELIPQLSRIAERGYVVAEVEYRPAVEAPFPAQVQDVQNAIRHLRVNADEYGIDLGQIVVMGNSSGGHCAVFASFLDAGGSAYPGVSAEVCCTIDLYGAVSLLEDDAFPTTPEHHCPDSPEGVLMGGVDLRAHPELRRIATAVCQIEEDTFLPPLLIAHGTKDRKVNVHASIDLFQHLRALDKDVELYLLQGADHGVAEFYSRRMIDIYDDFIRRHV